jgi:hypothetical protein
LFFTAGISDEAHGLFGFFTPADNSAPEANGDDRMISVEIGNDERPTRRVAEPKSHPQPATENQ